MAGPGNIFGKNVSRTFFSPQDRDGLARAKKLNLDTIGSPDTIGSVGVYSLMKLAINNPDKTIALRALKEFAGREGVSEGEKQETYSYIVRNAKILDVQLEAVRLIDSKHILEAIAAESYHNPAVIEAAKQKAIEI